MSIESIGVIIMAPPNPVTPRKNPATVTVAIAVISVACIGLGRQNTAIDWDNSTVYEAGAVGGEKDREVRDIR